MWDVRKVEKCFLFNIKVKNLNANVLDLEG